MSNSTAWRSYLRLLVVALRDLIVGDVHKTHLRLLLFWLTAKDLGGGAEERVRGGGRVEVKGDKSRMTKGRWGRVRGEQGRSRTNDRGTGTGGDQRSRGGSEGEGRRRSKEVKAGEQRSRGGQRMTGEEERSLILHESVPVHMTQTAAAATGKQRRALH